MQKNLEVLFTPADFTALSQRDLRQTVCLVFDVLRATSSMLNALAHGAKAIVPVSEITEALAQKRRQPDVLLAGEREGLRIRAAQTGGVDFDLGNSPREFTPEKVRGKSIVMTTTNGTRALQSCVGAKHVLIGSFANLGALAHWLSQNKNPSLLLVCAGTFAQAAYEDTLAAGALADLLWPNYATGLIADSAQMARQLYLSAKPNLSEAILFSKNARRLLQNPDLCDDVPFCLRRDTVNFTAELCAGEIRRTDVRLTDGSHFSSETSPSANFPKI